jgi:hypothetical protein
MKPSPKNNAFAVAATTAIHTPSWATDTAFRVTRTRESRGSKRSINKLRRQTSHNEHATIVLTRMVSLL